MSVEITVSRVAFEKMAEAMGLDTSRHTATNVNLKTREVKDIWLYNNKRTQLCWAFYYVNSHKVEMNGEARMKIASYIAEITDDERVVFNRKDATAYIPSDCALRMADELIGDLKQ